MKSGTILGFIAGVLAGVLLSVCVFGLTVVVGGSFTSTRQRVTSETIVAVETITPEARLTPELVPTDAPAPTRTPKPIPTTQPDLEILVKDHQCKVSKRDIYCVVTVTNPSRTTSVGTVYFDFNVFDPKDISIGGFWGATNSLFPGETRKVLVQNSLDEGTTFGRYSMSTRVSDWGNAGSQFVTNPLSVSNVEFKPGSFIYDTVIVFVNNQSNKTIDGVQLDAILYDKNGSVVGGGDGMSPILLPNGKARAEISVQKIGTVSKVEVYPSLSIIAKVK